MPITWRNINSPTADVAGLLRGAQAGVNAAGQSVLGAIEQNAQFEQDRLNQLRDRNTLEFRQALRNQFGTIEDLDAGVQSGAVDALADRYRGVIDREAVLNAPDVLRNRLAQRQLGDIQRQTAIQSFNDAQQARTRSQFARNALRESLSGVTNQAQSNFASIQDLASQNNVAIDRTGVPLPFRDQPENANVQGFFDASAQLEAIPTSTAFLQNYTQRLNQSGLDFRADELNSIIENARTQFTGATRLNVDDEAQVANLTESAVSGINIRQQRLTEDYERTARTNGFVVGNEENKFQVAADIMDAVIDRAGRGDDVDEGIARFARGERFFGTNANEFNAFGNTIADIAVNGLKVGDNTVPVPQAILLQAAQSAFGTSDPGEQLRTNLRDVLGTPENIARYAEASNLLQNYRTQFDQLESQKAGTASKIRAEFRVNSKLPGVGVNTIRRIAATYQIRNPNATEEQTTKHVTEELNKQVPKGKTKLTTEEIEEARKEIPASEQAIRESINVLRQIPSAAYESFSIAPRIASEAAGTLLDATKSEEERIQEIREGSEDSPTYLERLLQRVRFR